MNAYKATDDMRYARAVFCLYLFYRETLVRHAVVEQYRQHAVALHAYLLKLEQSGSKTHKYRVQPENVSLYLVLLQIALYLLAHLLSVFLPVFVAHLLPQLLAHLKELCLLFFCKFEHFSHNFCVYVQNILSNTKTKVRRFSEKLTK